MLQKAWGYTDACRTIAQKLRKREVFLIIILDKKQSNHKKCTNFYKNVERFCSKITISAPYFYIKMYKYIAILTENGQYFYICRNITL